MEHNLCVTSAELHRASNSGLELFLVILMLLSPCAIFATLLAKRTVGIKTRSTSIGIISFVALLGIGAIALFLPEFSEAGKAFVRYYELIFYLVAAVIYLFMVFLWIVAAFKSRWTPRAFDFVAATLILLTVFCVSALTFKALEFSALLQQPRCEKSNGFQQFPTIPRIE